VLAQPAAVWFLSGPEHELAHRLGPVTPRHAEIGAGVDVPDDYAPDAFRRRHRLERPFLLYAGRRELDKGWPWLLQAYEEAVSLSGSELGLVTIGVGDPEIPDRLAGRVVDLGFLPEHELRDAFAAACAYVQPSRMESFSRTIMESWLAGTPVLAWDRSPVVAWHCRRSGGGRTFSDAADLAQSMKWLVAAPDEATEMAARGRAYVLGEYTWPVVLDRMEESLAALPGPPPWSSPSPSHRRLMVVGSYPPSPRATAAVTVAQVQEAYGKGDDVVVVAPRQGAGHRTSRIVGLKAGGRLDELRSQTGARFLVFCLEPGLPFPAPGRMPPVLARSLQRTVARRLAAAFPAFEHVTLVMGRDLGVPADVTAVLTGAADRVVAADPPPPAALPGPVTLLGPREVLPRERPRQAISLAARAVLGTRAPAVRQRLAATARRLGARR
ncbi:MAG TPA: glycosyltransferase, partial [Acidimicrobiales bacterium]|nr:glycosyltransferase [Acidimicrobiales bacterium]